MDREEPLSHATSISNLFGRGTTYADKARSFIPERYQGPLCTCLKVLCVLLLFLLCVKFCWHETPKSCDPDWAHFEGHCFKLLEGKSFLDADHDCRLLFGAELASIHSASMNEFISNFANLRKHKNHVGAWIGLHRLAGTDAEWQWVDGSPADYFAWSRVDSEYDIDDLSRDQRWCALVVNKYYSNHKEWIVRKCDFAGQLAVCQKEP
ncbi:Protein CLEC-48 [Aphelenchoides avenae]|nr:Protein CLEC-48 [Aphelenchus avenae]